MTASRIEERISLFLQDFQSRPLTAHSASWTCKTIVPKFIRPKLRFGGGWCLKATEPIRRVESHLVVNGPPNYRRVGRNSVVSALNGAARVLFFCTSALSEFQQIWSFFFTTTLRETSEILKPGNPFLLGEKKSLFKGDWEWCQAPTYFINGDFECVNEAAWKQQRRLSERSSALDRPRSDSA